MEQEYDRIAESIRIRAKHHPKKRFLVALAGIPGAGKTTSASAVAQRLHSPNDPSTKTVLLSMDGFHLSRATLDKLPNREEAYIRRGAPWTFDCARFVAFIQQLREWADFDPSSSSSSSSSYPNSETDQFSHTIYAPTFDHEAKDPVENGMEIADDVAILIIEGNYLLLDEPGWHHVAPLVDYRIFIDADLQEARERVAKRHVRAGIEKTLEDGFRRVDRNDYLNALTIKDKLIQPDLVVQSIQEQDIS